MTSSPLRFELPAKLPPGLTRVRDYWESLKRGENDMPFWDDVKLSSLPDLSDCLMLIDAFENPHRFRLNSVAAQIRRSYGADLADKFVDEIAQKGPFEFLAAQASVTVKSKGPTLFTGQAGSGSGHHNYARLLLPMWGEGHIGMLLGAIVELA
jgi:hypothetical protein